MTAFHAFDYPFRPRVPMSHPPPAFARRRFLRLGTAATAAALAPLGIAPAFAQPAKADRPVYPLTGFSDAWEGLKTYDPETDPDARFFRSTVRRGTRIATLNTTQAHPGLSSEVQGGALVAAYLGLDGEDDPNRTRYASNTPRFVHVERNWQYLDVVVGWNSTGLIPNPALTDAVHRNGGLCLGTVFQPDKRMFNGTELSREDVAKRLVKLARYFGFDGYFVNFESFTETDAQAVHDLIAAMKSEARHQGIEDFYIQYYNGYTDIAAVWPGPPHADGRPRGPSEPRADSMMLDQGWGNYGLTHGCCSGPALTTLPTKANDPAFPGISSVYYGMQLYPGPGYLGLMGPTVVTPNGGIANGSLQIYSSDDGLRKMRNARLDALRAKADLSADERAEVLGFTAPGSRRNAWYNQHRHFWSGQTGNPAKDNVPTLEQLAIYGSAQARKIYTDYEGPHARPTDQMRLPITYGVANFIAERSVIGTLPFATSFNTGEGDHFWKDGVQLSDTGWFNLGAQDILPTWAWWTRPLGPDADIVTVDYDYTRAFDGGTSLKISAKPGAKAAAEIRLFKTDLSIRPDSEIGLVFSGTGKLSLGLVFADALDKTVWLPVSGTGDWARWTHALSDFAGRRLAVISLGYEGDGTAMNIGRLRLGSSHAAATPPRPQGFAIEKAVMSDDRQTATLRLSWRADPNVAAYDIISRHSDGTQQWLGRVSSDVYFVDRLERRPGEAATTLQLVPRGGDGQSGRSTTAALQWA